jgi:hypothetical protein
MLKTICIPETVSCNHESAWRQNPEHNHTQRPENLKSHKVLIVQFQEQNFISGYFHCTMQDRTETRGRPGQANNLAPIQTEYFKILPIISAII